MTIIMTPMNQIAHVARNNYITASITKLPLFVFPKGGIC